MDSSKEMLKIARKNVDAVKFLQGNMIKFDLKKTYDIITCLFSSIGYVKTYKNLRKTISNFYNHLKQGGVLIIEPWFTESVYQAGSPHLITYEDDYTKIARVNVSEKRGNLSILRMHYLIGVENKEVVHFKNKHELGLFEKEQTLQIIRETGFNVDYLGDGLMKERGLYIATK
jgi:SAM-dependent methyltransferase